MPTFLSDPPAGLYLVLFAFVVIAGAVAFRYQSKRSIAWFGAALALLLAVYLIDRLCESPREESVRRVLAIQQAMNERDPDKLVENVSDSFEYGNLRKADLKRSGLWSILRNYNARVVAWDFSRDDVEQIDDKNIRIGFLVKGEAEAGGTPYMLYIQAAFIRDADGRYRLKGFRAFEPIKRTDEQQVPL